MSKKNRIDWKFLARKYERENARQFSRGFYCAVAKMLEIQGTQPLVVELFRSGGNVSHADPEDTEIFKKHGLIK